MDTQPSNTATKPIGSEKPVTQLEVSPPTAKQAASTESMKPTLELPPPKKDPPERDTQKATETAPTKPPAAESKLPSVASKPSKVTPEAANPDTRRGVPLGLLTRKIVDMFKATLDRNLNVNDVAAKLNVPKDRVMDACEALTGLKLATRQSASVYGWIGSHPLVESHMDHDTKDAVERLREQIGTLHREESLIDQWMSRLLPSIDFRHAVATSDILYALTGTGETAPNKEWLVDENGVPKQTFLAVHSAMDTSIATVSKTTTTDTTETHFQLHVGTKRSGTPVGPHSKRSRTRDRIQVMVLPTKYDNLEHKLKPLPTRPLTAGSSDPSSTFDVHNALEGDTICDFY